MGVRKAAFSGRGTVRKYEDIARRTVKSPSIMNTLSLSVYPRETGLGRKREGGGLPSPSCVASDVVHLHESIREELQVNFCL